MGFLEYDTKDPLGRSSARQHFNWALAKAWDQLEQCPDAERFSRTSFLLEGHPDVLNVVVDVFADTILPIRRDQCRPADWMPLNNLCFYFDPK